MTAAPPRRALITGASGGIGGACARRLAADGWDLVLHASRHPDRAEAVAAECREAGVDAAVWGHDLAEPIAPATLKELQQDGPVTGLVHAAGIPAEGLALRIKPETAERAMRINLLSAMDLVRGMSRGMLGARWGRIVLVGSTAGLAGNPGQSLYSATKMGLVGYARSLARELAPRGITANVVAPGWIETEMADAILQGRRTEIEASIPSGRIGRPEEVAATVAFLMTADAAYITGQTVAVNGGIWML